MRRPLSIPFKCDRCGTIFTPNFIEVGSNAIVHINNNRFSCPVPGCFGWGHHKTATYQVVDGVIKAFTASGMTRQNVVDARAIAKEASTRSITSEEAIQRLEAISANLAEAILQPGQRKINWELILALLVCIYTIWTDRGSDKAAQASLAEAQTQTAISQKILEETQELNKSVRELKTTPPLRPPAPAQTNGTKNRHERRKQNAIENRTQKKPPNG